MAQTSKAIQTGITRIFARFGRKTRKQNPSQEGRPETRWYESDISSRGL
jgi:hypothetical protein